jgi:FixJ family two-component response regulator
MLDPASVVFVVDDDVSVREALSSLIRSIGLNVVLCASPAEFMSVRRADVPSCLVLDVRLPGQSGLDLQKELRAAGESIPVIFITGHGDIPMTVRAMKAGAVEFLSKPFREQELLDAIVTALVRDAEERSRSAEISAIHKALDTLSLRERQVMDGLVVGMLNKQVAARLGVSEVTVKIHRRHVMEKMAVSSLVQLARMIEKIR